MQFILHFTIVGENCNDLAYELVMDKIGNNPESNPIRLR